MSDSSLIPLYVGITAALVLLIINAWFSAGRKAISEANKTKIREMSEKGSVKANRALPIMENPSEYKLVIRELNVLIYMIYSLICTNVILWSVYTNLFGGPGISLYSSIIIWIIGIFVFLIFLLAIGEMFPRRIAMQHAEGIVIATAASVKVLRVLFKPTTLCVSAIAFIFLKIFRQRTDLNDNEYSEEDIVEMLEVGQESGELKEEGKKMITGVFAFDDILAYEIMTPRTEVFAIDINSPAEEYIDELMELRYSRIPVYENDNDEIIGILYIKDYLIKAREEGFDNVDIRSILRAPYFVPDTKNIDSLFVELQKTKQHIAVLINEYGSFCGIVTMEDIIEEVMGDIDDEYDEEEEEIRKLGRNVFLVEGSVDIDDVNEELGTNFVSEDSETIGGFIIDMFGEIPDEDDIGKEISYEDCLLTIKSVKDRRIEQIIIETNKAKKEDEGDE